MSEHFPRPGALLFDKRGAGGEPLWGILIRNDSDELRVFWGDGRQSEIFQWQLEEYLIQVVVP